jgi:3-hydroxymyristoyl/3-hydroxydecanoyl-(acyl carrier protein) dehydratase
MPAPGVGNVVLLLGQLAQLRAQFPTGQPHETRFYFVGIDEARFRNRSINSC